MDTIPMEMSKTLKVTDGHKDEGWTIVNSPWQKLTWGKAPGELTVKDLKRCSCSGHCGYRSKMVLAVLNLHVTSIPPTKSWLSLTFRSRADEV